MELARVDLGLALGFKVVLTARSKGITRRKWLSGPLILTEHEYAKWLEFCCFVWKSLGWKSRAYTGEAIKAWSSMSRDDKDMMLLGCLYHLRRGCAALQHDGLAGSDCPHWIPWSLLKTDLQEPFSPCSGTVASGPQGLYPSSPHWLSVLQGKNVCPPTVRLYQ